LCEDCFQQMGPYLREWKVDGFVVHSCYFYNETIRSLLYQFKGCFDVELADVFLFRQAPYFRLHYHGYTLVPAPSYQAKDEARGFNHVEAMFACLGLPFLKAIEKIDDVKQADNNYAERQKIGEHLHFKEGAVVRGLKILFVDDLFTTGATAKACAHLLKEHGAKKVEILVMGYTPEKALDNEIPTPRGLNEK
jgi:competence protein ComFC